MLSLRQVDCLRLVADQLSTRGGVAGASVAAGGGTSRVSTAGAAGVRTVPPIWSITDDPSLCAAAMMVSAIDVEMKAAARTHVSLAKAEVTPRPDVVLPPPPPMPKPPPSDRCINTRPISTRARIKWTVRTTFSMGIARS